ncbi:hypothetical protein HK097_004886 [Rhizophlyctis rosea]|uniref:Uncharacterized protein n=1 Tax=Rhizophlyctis rosea TaxID=64517 RepID=A0AAD5S2K6_9FUNG|nr:hypothetical protein HK097_004886 [Rhizophlyctis rosea]
MSAVVVPSLGVECLFGRPFLEGIRAIVDHPRHLYHILDPITLWWAVIHADVGNIQTLRKLSQLERKE